MPTELEIELAMDYLTDNAYPIDKRIEDLKVYLELLTEARENDNSKLELERAKALAKAAGWLERAIRKEQSSKTIVLDTL